MPARPLANGPAPDPARVAALAAHLRSETAYQDALAHVAGAITHLSMLLDALPLAQAYARARGPSARAALTQIPQDDIRRLRPLLRRALLLSTKGGDRGHVA